MGAHSQTSNLLKTMQNKKTTRAFIGMHVAIFLWGFTAIFGKGITLSEGVLVWYRLLLTLLSIFIWVKINNRNLAVAKADRQKMAKIGVVIMLHWVTFYGSIKYANISIALCMLSGQGFFTALLEPIMTDEKFSWSNIFFGLFGMAGIFVIFWSENNFWIGAIVGLVSAFLSALFNVMNKQIAGKVDVEKIAFYEMFYGFLALTAILPFYGYFFHIRQYVPTATDWLQLLILAIACTHLTQLLANYALRYVSAFTLSLSTNLEPVYGILLAFIFFKENNYLSKGFFIGAFIIFLSVLLHSLFNLRKTATTANASLNGGD